MYMNMFAQVCYMLVNAVSQAAGIIIGYCIGARDFDRARTGRTGGCCAFSPR